MTPTTQPDYPALIRKAGWEPETHDFGVSLNPLIAHRATQRQFKTPWLLSWSEVLDYIKGRKEP